MPIKKYSAESRRGRRFVPGTSFDAQTSVPATTIRVATTGAIRVGVTHVSAFNHSGGGTTESDRGSLPAWLDVAELAVFDPAKPCMPIGVTPIHRRRSD